MFKLVCIKTEYYIIGLLIEKKIHIYETAEFMALKLLCLTSGSDVGVANVLVSETLHKFDL